MVKVNRILARFVGNFGVSFFGPLVGANAANAIFPQYISFVESLVIAGISACLVSGMAISKEIAAYGERRQR